MPGMLQISLIYYTTINFTNNQVLFTPDRSLYGKDLWINALQAENNFGDIKMALSLSHSATEQYTIFGYAPGIYGGGWNQFYDANATANFGYDASGKAITYSSPGCATEYDAYKSTWSL